MPTATKRVRRRGLITRAGHYPDKRYTITPDDLARVAREWCGPLPIDLEHTSTILDGQLGELERVEVTEDGRALLGDVSLPDWLAALLGDAALKVSCTWDRATKTLAGLSLVLSSRIDDAVLVAAFAAAHDGGHWVTAKGRHIYIGADGEWPANPESTAFPKTLHGVAFGPAPKEFWRSTPDKELPGVPPMQGKHKASGVILMEPDGRVWVRKPTPTKSGKPYGGHAHTFAKGGLEAGLTEQQNALKETWEETGLQGEIQSHLGDFASEETGGVTRFFTGRRVGGHPAHMGWESEAVKLVTLDEAAGILSHSRDKAVLSALRQHLRAGGPNGGPAHFSAAERAAVALYHKLRHGYLTHGLALETAEHWHDCAIGFGFLSEPDWYERAGLATFGDGGEKGHWVTIHGHPVFLNGEPVSETDIHAAAKAHGLSFKSKKALLAAHAEGKLPTDEHLYHAIAIGKAHQQASIAAGKSEPGKPLHESAMLWGLKHGTLDGLQEHAEGHPDPKVQAHAQSVLGHMPNVLGAGLTSIPEPDVMPADDEAQGDPGMQKLTSLGANGYLQLLQKHGLASSAALSIALSDNPDMTVAAAEAILTKDTGLTGTAAPGVVWDSDAADWKLPEPEPVTATEDEVLHIAAQQGLSASATATLKDEWQAGNLKTMNDVEYQAKQFAALHASLPDSDADEPAPVLPEPTPPEASKGHYVTLAGKTVTLTDAPITPDNVLGEASKLHKLSSKAEGILQQAVASGKVKTHSKLAQLLAIGAADWVSGSGKISGQSMEHALQVGGIEHLKEAASKGSTVAQALKEKLGEHSFVTPEEKAAAAKAKADAAAAQKASEAKLSGHASRAKSIEAFHQAASLDDLAQKQIGPQGGSNPGGLYEGKGGVQSYVKFIPDAERVHEEHIANAIYDALEIPVPHTRVLAGADGKPALASLIVPTKGKVGHAEGLSKAQAEQFLEGFAADVLLANHDVVGTGATAYDNIVHGDDGQVYRIDNGGGLLHKATGPLKSGTELEAAKTFTGFFGTNKHYASVASAAGVTSPMQVRGLNAQIRKIAKLRDQHGGWQGFLQQHAPNMDAGHRERVAAFLDERMAFLESQHAKALTAEKKRAVAAAKEYTAHTSHEAGASWVNQHFAAQATGASSDDAKAAGWWQHGTWKSGNEALFTGKWDALAADQRQHIAQLDSLFAKDLSKVPAGGVVVHRRFGLSAPDEQALKQQYMEAEPGALFRVRGYQAASYGSGPGGYAASHGVVWHIHVPEGASLVHIDGVKNKATGMATSSADAEREVLVNRGAKLRVLRTYQKGAEWHQDLELVPSAVV